MGTNGESNSQVKQKIAYVIGSPFPSDTESFVVNELKGLANLGFDILVFSVYGEPTAAGNDAEWSEKTVYAEPIFSARIILAHLYFLFTRPALYLSLMRSYSSFRGKRVVWKSVYFAREVLRRDVKHIHAHFAWVATDSARLISKLTGITYSLTAHMSDINLNADYNLYDKLKDAEYIFTCTKGNKKYLGEKFGEEILGKTTAIYHGVNTRMFVCNGRQVSPEVDILSIGRLVRTKGLEYLINACALLTSKGLAIKCVIVGQGPERENLEELISGLDLTGVVEIKDTVPHSKVSELYLSSRLLVLPVLSVDGYPQGIPNVIAEAMAMGLPVVASDVPDIPELITDGKDGVLVVDKDPAALAVAIEKLLLDEKMRQRLSKAARRKVEEVFDSNVHIKKIAREFTRHLA